ncbi:zona pellucida-binding protein 1 isoform B [Alligator mississippiensis]|uniref:Zona pellucida-binding protein 1 isoform B n=1 Tax=Alligator mississippiensis TaxID=8496 RepID=A0A151P1G6_ALLMI|nr:zona pellucida-binding protein 1 isoform B [Alligator mississippiensis]
MSHPVGWTRGRGAPAAPSPAVRLAALLLAFLLQAAPAVNSSERFSRSINEKSKDMKIVGSTTFPVKVYVKLNHDSPRILCVTNRLRVSELIDPIFQWHGPNGDMVAENSSVKITPTGTLIFRHFKYDMSGVYTCSIVYKPTAEQSEKNYLIKYVIYAYSDPDYYYEFTARYHSAPCNSIYNVSFEKKLLQILAKLVAELSCEVTLVQSECHHVKMQKAGLQNEIFFTFRVSSFEENKPKNRCQKNTCDKTKRLNKLSVAQEHTIPVKEFIVFSATGL